jgi:NADPH:quinone reductase
MKAIRVHSPGGPEVLKYEDVPEPTPGTGQAAVRLGASGVNFIDVYFRTGAYKAPLPLTVGIAGAGTTSRSATAWRGRACPAPMRSRTRCPATGS